MKDVFKKVTAVALFALTLQGCGGNRDNNNAIPPQYFPPGGQVNCIPGQPNCYNPGGVYSGGPLLNGPAVSSLDGMGSAMILQFAASGATGTSSQYNGQVAINGTIQLAPGACFNLPPGNYPVQGQGVWVSGYAGAVAGIQAQLQMQNGQITITSAVIKSGTNPLNPQAGFGNFLQGLVQVSVCGRTFTAL